MPLITAVVGGWAVWYHKQCSARWHSPPTTKACALIEKILHFAFCLTCARICQSSRTTSNRLVDIAMIWCLCIYRPADGLRTSLYCHFFPSTLLFRLFISHLPSFLVLCPKLDFTEFSAARITVTVFFSALACL